MNMITIKAKRRGQLADETKREYEYQGLGREVQETDADGKVTGSHLEFTGVITDYTQALEATGGDDARVWDAFVLGFNEMAREAAIASSDELVPYLDPAWNAETVKSFRRAVTAARNVLSDMGLDVPLDKIVEKQKALLAKKAADKVAA